MKKITLLALSLIMIISSCKEDDEIKVMAKGIEVSPNTVSIVVGNTIQLNKTITPKETFDKTVVWKSEDESIATIDKEGIISALKAGKTVITATTSNDLTAKCSIEVTDKVIPVTGIKLDKTTLSIEEGFTSTLKANILPENATNKEYIWSSSNTDIVSVEDGLVLALKEGNAEILVTSEDGDKVDKCSVTVFKSGEVSTFVDPRDGKEYKTIQIGEQTWLAENLAYLPEVSDISNMDNSSNLYLVYGYEGTSVEDAKSEENYKKYGVLYNYSSARSACPEGWHLPTDVEWQELERYLGVSEDKLDIYGYRGDIAPGLKSNIGWNGAGLTTNENRFSALPSGMYTEDDQYTGIDEDACYWTRSFMDISNIIIRNLNNDTDAIRRSYAGGTTLMSVRCIKTKIINATSVTLDAENISVIEGESILITATVLPENASDRAVTWTSSNEEIATVTAGVVNALKEGEVTITATVGDGSISAQATITVEKKPTPDNDGKCIDPDGREYKTVVIGEQEWMAENYAYLPSVVKASYYSSKVKCYYVYNYNGNDINEAKETEEYKTFGVLYNRVAAIECAPKGWHLPTDEDWKELERAIGMTEDEINSSYSRGDKGKKLMKTSDWNDNIGTDDYGFAAVPGGYLDTEMGFLSKGGSGKYFSSSEGYTSGYSCTRTISHGSISISTFTENAMGLSVRYVKDKK